MDTSQGYTDIFSFLNAQSGLLADYVRPGICYKCLGVTVLAFGADSSVRSSCRSRCHDFWDAAIAFITAPRTDGDISVLRHQLAMNADNCRHRNVHVSPPADEADPLQMLVQSLYTLLSESLIPTSLDHGILHGKDPKKTFGKRGLWPSHPKDLVPFGERQCAEAHVRWCCQLYTPAAMRTLTVILLGCRPLVFSCLLEEELREQLIWCLVQMLVSDTGRDDYAWSDRISWPRPPRDGLRVRVWMSYLTHHMSIGVAASFLESILSGPDCKPDDGVRFSTGFEYALLPALNTALDLAKEACLDSSAVLTLATWAYYVHQRMENPKPALHRSARIELERLEEIAKSSDNWTWPALQRALYKMYSVRTCYGPSCGKGLHQTSDGRPLQLCARCKFTQYCSKECQRADWKHATWPHKEFCPVLRVLTPALRGPVAAFGAAIHATHSGDVVISQDVMIRFSNWALSRGTISNQLPSSSAESNH